jgi:hypothetical protein
MAGGWPCPQAKIRVPQGGIFGPGKIAFDTLVVLALPLGVGALEVFYAVFPEDP